MRGQKVEIRSVASTRDKYGDTSGISGTRWWAPCLVAPRSSNERADPRSPAVITGLTVYGPDVQLDSDDVLVIEGKSYKVDGEPGVWRSPTTGAVKGVEVAVSRWDQP